MAGTFWEFHRLHAERGRLDFIGTQWFVDYINSFSGKQKKKARAIRRLYLDDKFWADVEALMKALDNFRLIQVARALFLLKSLATSLEGRSKNCWLK